MGGPTHIASPLPASLNCVLRGCVRVGCADKQDRTGRVRASGQAVCPDATPHRPVPPRVLAPHKVPELAPGAVSGPGAWCGSPHTHARTALAMPLVFATIHTHPIYHAAGCDGTVCHLRGVPNHPGQGLLNPEVGFSSGVFVCLVNFCHNNGCSPCLRALRCSSQRAGVHSHLLPTSSGALFL